MFSLPRHKVLKVNQSDNTAHGGVAIIIKN